MPIRPENRARYPKTWRQMVGQARERSGDRCECLGQCGLAHDGGRCNAENKKPHPTTGSIVVLTLAHVHGVPLEETDIARMFHACQQCHNRYDAPMRRRGIQERARAAAALVQSELVFDYCPEEAEDADACVGCKADGRGDCAAVMRDKAR